MESQMIEVIVNDAGETETTRARVPIGGIGVFVVARVGDWLFAKRWAVVHVPSRFRFLAFTFENQAVAVCERLIDSIDERLFDAAAIKGQADFDFRYAIPRPVIDWLCDCVKSDRCLPFKHEIKITI